MDDVGWVIAAHLGLIALLSLIPAIQSRALAPAEFKRAEFWNGYCGGFAVYLGISLLFWAVIAIALTAWD